MDALNPDDYSWRNSLAAKAMENSCMEALTILVTIINEQQPQFVNCIILFVAIPHLQASLILSFLLLAFQKKLSAILRMFTLKYSPQFAMRLIH